MGCRPFAGVGTTLVQTFLRGYNVVGFEINPYAALASRLKLKALDVPVDAFSQRIVEFEQFMEVSTVPLQVEQAQLDTGLDIH